jgi:hypothetical protein
MAMTGCQNIGSVSCAENQQLTVCDEPSFSSALADIDGPHGRMPTGSPGQI